MKKVAIVLSGCGHRDGAEITESVSTLIAVTEHGAQYKCFALDQDFAVTNHITGESSGEKRNIMREAARIARGSVNSLSELNPTDFDALIFPGGFGAALHLSTWATEGSTCKVQNDVERVIKAFYKAGKPICAICIAPTLLAKVLGQHKVTLTIGNDLETAAEIAKTGAIHEKCDVEDYCTDREHKIVTTPAYMLQGTSFQIFKGIRNAIRETLEMA